jgi:hypothetical protein
LCVAQLLPKQIALRLQLSDLHECRVSYGQRLGFFAIILIISINTSSMEGSGHTYLADQPRGNHSPALNVPHRLAQ